MTSEFDQKINQEKTSKSDEVSASDESVKTETPQDPEVSNIIKNHVIASLALGLIPIPVFDVAALTASQMSLLRSLSEHYEVEDFDNGNQKALLLSLAGGSLPVLGIVGLSSITKMIPGIGSLAGSAGLAISAGSLTYAVGRVFSMHFAEGGTFEDFEPSLARDYFKRELESGKQFVKSIQEEIKLETESKAEVDKPESEKTTQA